MKRYLCIHGHFYQPPRENPWLEAIERQDSAYPYHDWNERITAQCYAPNAVSRILDGEGYITRVVNNYARISFNFGPTLLDWLERNSPDVYRAILEADRESQRHFSGHGSAMAQAYNHMILPLAHQRDKETQVAWGIRDFERRFARKPEGMWLPETAADHDTLEALAAAGIRFTVLAPNQAQRIRPIAGAKGKSEGWVDVSGSRIDPARAYRARLRSGRTLDLFFYDGPISQGVAFEGILQKGEFFAERLMSAFSDARDWPQLVHIATDGETYGHHHTHGDMALASALEHIDSNPAVELTNYGEYLERHPPTHEVDIFDNSSWSCVHGVERWKADCGCNSGGRSGWNQQWRAPLREALDWLRDSLVPLYEQQGMQLLQNPWCARNEYIDVILDRSPANVEAFLTRHGRGALSTEQRVQALKLLEMQRHAMLMYTSCGWFFDELSGIETVQVIQYAGRALQLSQQLDGNGREEEFLRRLENARCNIAEHGDGRRVYENFVRPAKLDLQKVGAHYAVSSLFEPYEPETQTYCYTVRREDHRLLSAGKAKLALGRARITSQVTLDSEQVTYGVLHLGDHNLSGGVRAYQGDAAYTDLARRVTEGFERGDLSELLRQLEADFGSGAYTLKLLFRDEQRKILNIILESALTEADAAYGHLYEHYAPLMRFITDLGLPRPRRFQVAAEFTLNAGLRRALKARPLDLDLIRARIDEAARTGVQLDSTTLEFALRRQVETIAREFLEEPADARRLREFSTAAAAAELMPFEVNLWAAQNAFFSLLSGPAAEFRRRMENGNAEAAEWWNEFRALGVRLKVRAE